MMFWKYIIYLLFYKGIEQNIFIGCRFKVCSRTKVKLYYSGESFRLQIVLKTVPLFDKIIYAKIKLNGILFQHNMGPYYIP